MEEKTENIAVICYDINDFISWKKEQGFVEKIPFYKEKFKVYNKVYYCITKLIDLHSKTFDNIIETNDASKNKEYGLILIQLYQHLNLPITTDETKISQKPKNVNKIDQQIEKLEILLKNDNFKNINGSDCIREILNTQLIILEEFTKLKEYVIYGRKN